MPMDVTAARRLAYIRYLHHLGREQSQLPEPLSSAAVLMLHDAVESFLLLAAEHVGVNPPPQFEKYWEVLSKSPNNGVELATKQGMVRLNRVRVALKHHGAHPDRPTVDQIVSDTDTFMSANSTLVFGVDYETVSLAHAIPHEIIRDLAQRAEVLAKDGDHKGAMILLAEAFDLLMSPHQANTRHRNGKLNPFSFGVKTSRLMRSTTIVQILRSGNTPDRRGRPTDFEYRHLAQQISDTSSAVQRLQIAMRLIALGIDFAAYERFRTLTPHIIAFFGGRREFLAPENYSPDRTDFEYCLQFILTASLRLSEAESHLTPPKWEQTEDGQAAKWVVIAESQTHPREES